MKLMYISVAYMFTVLCSLSDYCLYKEQLSTVRPRKKQNPQTKVRCDQVVGCMTVISHTIIVKYDHCASE